MATEVSVFTLAPLELTPEGHNMTASRTVTLSAHSEQ